MKKVKPTPAQRRVLEAMVLHKVLRLMAKGKKLYVETKITSKLLRRGWIEKINRHKFFTITAAGRAAIGKDGE